MNSFRIAALGLALTALLLEGCSSAPSDPVTSEANQTASSSGDAGAGSVPTVGCEDAAEDREGGSCLPTDPGNACQLCVQERCCLEQAACNAVLPDESCAFGSTLYAGKPLFGEIACVMECFAHREDEGSFQASPNDVGECAGVCGASECDRAEASETTRILAECIVGLGGPEGNCLAECGLTAETPTRKNK